LVAAVFDRKRGQFIEGDEGEARTVTTPFYLSDGKRRITVMPRLLGYAGKSQWVPYGRGMSTMQAVMEKVS
jgi:hypothetical protein